MHRCNDQGGKRREVSQTLGASVGLESSPMQRMSPYALGAVRGMEVNKTLSFSLRGSVTMEQIDTWNK